MRSLSDGKLKLHKKVVLHSQCFLLTDAGVSVHPHPAVVHPHPAVVLIWGCFGILKKPYVNEACENFLLSGKHFNTDKSHKTSQNIHVTFMWSYFLNHAR